MYEQGLGVTKDLHLAKRYLDLAADTANEALVPVALALFKLRLLFFYSYFVDVSSFEMICQTLLKCRV